MTPAQREALEAYETHGSQRKAAQALGITRFSLRDRLVAAWKHQALDPAIKGAMQEAGMQDAEVLHSGWIKTEGASLYFQVPSKETTSIVDRIKDALADLPAVAPVEPPEHVLSDLLTVYPIADAHIGMMAWGRETGEDYNTRIAVERLQSWMARAVAASPASDTAIILDVGDLTHADDQSNMTPRSKHILDVDTRHFRTIEMTISALATCVDLALTKHKKVIVRVLPGNHNPQAYLAVLFAIAERYRDEPRCEVQKVPGEFFVHQWGKCLIAAHHGDKAKADRIVMYLADEHAEAWGQTRHRFLFTGHLHHHKSADIGGCKWEQLRAVTAKDAYAASHAYASRAQLQAITYDMYHGEIQRVSVAG